MPKRFLAAAELARRAYPYVRKYGPAVYTGAKYGYQAVKGLTAKRALPPGNKHSMSKYRKVGEWKTTSHSMTQTKQKKKKDKGTQFQRGGGLGGTLRGRLAKLRRGYGKYLAQFNREGIVSRHRAIGQGDDQDAVYIMNEAVAPYLALRYTLCAVLRKLFEKTGWRITGIHDVIAMGNAGNPSTYSTVDYKVHLEVLDQATGAITQTTYQMTTTSELITVANYFIGNFIDYCSGYNSASGSGSANNLKVPVRFFITFLIGESNVLKSELHFTETLIDLYAESTVYVQNRTVSTTDASADASNVTNHPLHGTVYYFKGLPKARARGQIINIPQAGGMAPSRTAGNQFGFEPVDHGCKILGAASLYDEDFKYPPESNFWWNCVSSGKGTLDPGVIKHYNIKFRKSMRFLNFCKALRLQYTETANDFQTDYSMFPVQMIGMTSVINSANHEIDLGVEINRVFAVKCTQKKGKYCRTHTSQETVSETVITA